MCRGHIYVRMCPYTCVCYPHTRVHTYTNFARVYVPCFHILVQFVCVRVCVFPSEMECVLFYSRKIAHRANVICCIMYPTLNKFYLILSYLHAIEWRMDTSLLGIQVGNCKSFASVNHLARGQAHIVKWAIDQLQAWVIQHNFVI